MDEKNMDSIVYTSRYSFNHSIDSTGYKDTIHSVPLLTFYPPVSRHVPILRSVHKEVTADGATCDSGKLPA